MASPFYLFRKYQRAFIAIAAVVAMFIFVVADPLMTWLQSSGGGPQRSANTVVASWNDGEINLMELDRLTQRRYKISQFLRNLVGRAAQKIELQGGTALPPNLPDFRLPNTNPQAVQQGCVFTQIFAERAKDAGISVSDAFINHFLKEWGLGNTSDTEIADLLSSVGLSDRALFAGLRELLMTHFYTTSYTLSSAGAMPEERWEDWKRLNERIVVEAAVLPTESFVSEVPEPTDAQLKSFYEEHKDRVDGSFDLVSGVPLPSPNPGFREPRRVKVQYLEGNVSDWTLKLQESVTEEEIADYYERNKRTLFVKTSSSVSSADTSIEGLFDDESPATDESESNDAATDGAAASDEEMEDNQPEPEPDDPETDEPATDEASSSSIDGESIENSGDNASEAAEETEAPPTESPADNETGRVGRPSPFRLVSLQEETEAVAEEGEASEEESASEEPASTNADDTSEDDAGEGEEPLEFEPLENVKDQIRRSLAVDKAVVELQKLVDRTTATLQTAYNPYGFEVVSARTEEREVPEPPAKLADYKAIATETGLNSNETVLLSQRGLSETIVGRAVDAQSRTQLVHQAMFSDLELFEPFRAIDLEGNAYIVCKTEDVPSRVPDFEEVRDDVLAAWKQAEAAKLALAKAEEMAKSAQESGDTVAVVAGAGNYKTVTTDAFSWLTYGGATQADMQRPPRLSQVPPLESVGIEFMEKAFELKPNEKVAVTNYDKSAAYVVQLDRREMTEDEMKQQFLSDSVNGWFGGQMMNVVRSRVARSQFETELGEEIDLNLDMLREIQAANSQQ